MIVDRSDGNKLSSITVACIWHATDFLNWTCINLRVWTIDFSVYQIVFSFLSCLGESGVGRDVWRDGWTLDEM